MNVLKDYYLGLIRLNPFVYKKDKAERMLYDVNYDPFAEIDMPTAIFQGIVTLLKKINEEEYCVEYASRYKNEVKVKLNQTNNLGINLVYLKPLQEVYKEKPRTFIKEEIEDNYEILEDILFNDEYYLVYSKLDKTTVPIIVREEKFEIVREEYFDKAFRNENISKQKK